MVSKRSARFRELAAALDEECRRRGLPLRPDAAEEMLASRVREVATAISVQESTALRTYFSDDWPVTMAESLALAAQDMEQSRQGPPVAMPSVLAAQLVSALGVAAKFAAVNSEHARRDECVLVGASAGDAVTILGAALRESVDQPTQAPGKTDVMVARDAAHAARDALRLFASRIADGSWRDCWCGEKDLRHVDMEQLSQQVENDLRLVELVIEP